MNEAGRLLFDNLTAREGEVFSLCVKGCSNKKIAQELSISVKTVETHRASINKRLGVHSSLQLFRLAAFSGLVEGLVPEKGYEWKPVEKETTR